MLLKYKDTYPNIGKDVYLAEGVKIIGDVTLGDDVNVWFNTVIRGDVNFIKIGARSNVQDLSMLHVTTATHPLVIGEGVTIGHSVTLHGCTIGKYSLIGMGATILDGAVIGEESVIGAGALILEGMKIPPRSLVIGVPGKIRKTLSDDDVKKLYKSADNYVKYAKEYMN